MERSVMWSPWAGPGLEHLRLVQYQGGVLADGIIIGVAEGTPFRARYVIQCDEGWRVREVRVDLLDESNRRVELTSDGAGHWTDSAGMPLPALVGCFDVDISATPFTNTLPIRRLALAPGASADVNVAYIAMPTLLVQPERQHYTCLATAARSSTYRFEASAGAFVAELPTDADGLVEDYPGLFRRMTSVADRG
jgi:uncharacterized protein